jgi:hypothetical protein
LLLAGRRGLKQRVPFFVSSRSISEQEMNGTMVRDLVIFVTFVIFVIFVIFV